MTLMTTKELKRRFSNKSKPDPSERRMNESTQQYHRQYHHHHQHRKHPHHKMLSSPESSSLLGAVLAMVVALVVGVISDSTATATTYYFNVFLRSNFKLVLQVLLFTRLPEQSKAKSSTLHQDPRNPQALNLRNLHEETLNPLLPEPTARVARISAARAAANEMLGVLCRIRVSGLVQG